MASSGPTRTSTDVVAASGDDDDIIGRHRRRRWLLIISLTLMAAALLSVALGSKAIPLGDVLRALGGNDGSDNAIIIIEQRIPRTVLAIVVGAALAVSGALMQGLTRNPLADPGLLGISAGASFAMAIGVAVLPITTPAGMIWFAFAGASVTTVFVYVIGSAGRAGASPVTLALAGVAVGAVLSGITTTLTILNSTTFLRMRFWTTGALTDRGWDVVATITPFVVVGLAASAAAARGLNASALGDDLALALGSNPRRTRLLVVFGVTLLCGAATAAVGPIWFLGMMVPHVARWIVGPDQRWILAISVLIGPTLMLLADVIGRVVVRPSEMPAGLVTAFVGAPVLIALVRRAKASAL